MPDTTPAPAQAARILNFWLDDGLTQGWPTTDMTARWFKGSAELDRQIASEFGSLLALALKGQLQDWEAAPADRLGLVILLDQFPRNVYRGTAQAFAGDARAQQLTLDALARQDDQQLPWIGRVFLLMPLMHAENLALQQECVRRFEALVAEAPAALKDKLRSNLDFARQHAAIIESFGRFPYRNAALGRPNTAAEDIFLTAGPRFGQ